MFWLGSVLSARIGAQMRPLALLVWSLLLIDRDELKWISIMYQERNYMRAALSVLLAVVFLGIELFAIGYVSANPFGGPVRVHSGPGPKWSVVGELHAGDEVSVSDCVRGWGQHDWCKVSSAGIEGFVHEGALAPSGDRIFVAPVVTGAPAKLRKRPGSGSAVVATIPASAQVHVAHCTHGWLRGWCKVNLDGRTGFVRSESLRRGVAAQ